MSEHPERRARRRFTVPGPLMFDDRHSIGEEALHFTRWFLRSKYRLMGDFLGELVSDGRDLDALKARYCRTLQHAQRVQTAQGIVTILLALGAIAAAGSGIASALGLGEILKTIAAFAASITIVLLALRLAISRYLERVDVVATLLAIELSASAQKPPPAAHPA